MASISLKEIAKNMKVNSFKFSDMHTKLFAGSSDGTFSIKNFYNRTLNQDYYIFKNKADFDSKINEILNKYNNDLSSISFGFENGLENENITFPASIIKSPITIYANKCISVKKIFGATNLKEVSELIFRNIPNLENASLCLGRTRITIIPEKIFFYNPQLIDANNAFCGNTKSSNTLIQSLPIKNIPEKLFINNLLLENLNWCFNGCEIEKIPVNLFKNNINLKYLIGCFNFTNIKEVPFGLFDDNPNIEDASFCFNCSKQLEAIPEGLFINKQKLKNISTCFQRANIKTVPKNLLTNSPNIEDASYLFNNVYNTTTVDEHLFDTNLKIKTFKQCFHNCSNITSKIPVVWDRTGVDLTKYAANCTKALNYNDIPSNARGIMENNNYLEENIDNYCYIDCLGDEDLE